MSEQMAVVSGASSEDERLRRSLRPSASMFILAAACAIQAVRVVHGLDFNDEMQYYGELISLVESGRLFSTDLFLQQMVYLLLYPIFKIYFHLWGTESLILAGRILFACFALWIFRGVRRRFVNAGVESVIGSICALAVTFCLPLYNIYAFSYNTVAMGISALCFAELFQWRRRSGVPSRSFWSLSLVMLLLVYPPLAIGIGIVVLLRLLVERDHRSIGRIAASSIAFGVATTIAALQFTTVDEFSRAVEFTRAIGVGTAIFQSGFLSLAAVWGIVVFGLVLNRWPLPNWAGKSRSRNRTHIVILVVVMTTVATRHAVRHDVWLAALIMMLVGYFLTTWVADDEQREKRLWISVMFLVVGSIMAVTSGNGFKQIQGAALLATPFYFALATMKAESSGESPCLHHPGARALGFGMLAVFAALYLFNPYCDEPVWNQTTSTSEVPAFRHLRITDYKARAISLIRSVLSDIAPGRRVMVVGAHPWIYMATDTRPDTDMIFMHPAGGPEAYEILADRIANRRPEYVVVAGNTMDGVAGAVADLLASEKYTCVSRPIEPWLIDARKTIGTLFPMLPALFVCRAPSDGPVAN